MGWSNVVLLMLLADAFGFWFLVFAEWFVAGRGCLLAWHPGC